MVMCSKQCDSGTSLMKIFLLNISIIQTKALRRIDLQTRWFMSTFTKNSSGLLSSIMQRHSTTTRHSANILQVEWGMATKTKVATITSMSALVISRSLFRSMQSEDTTSTTSTMKRMTATISSLTWLTSQFLINYQMASMVSIHSKIFTLRRQATFCWT